MSLSEVIIVSNSLKANGWRCLCSENISKVKCSCLCQEATAVWFGRLTRLSQTSPDQRDPAGTEEIQERQDQSREPLMTTWSADL